MSRSASPKARGARSAAAAPQKALVIDLNEPLQSRRRQHPIADDLGMRWAVAWYEGQRTYKQRRDHVAA